MRCLHGKQTRMVTQVFVTVLLVIRFRMMQALWEDKHFEEKANSNLFFIWETLQLLKLYDKLEATDYFSYFPLLTRCAG